MINLVAVLVRWTRNRDDTGTSRKLRPLSSILASGLLRMLRSGPGTKRKFAAPQKVGRVIGVLPTVSARSSHSDL